jgi:DNA polymerase/3'-5' exonuclease PolX
VPSAKTAKPEAKAARAGPTNAEIADALSELGDLYELDGAIAYRVAAYRTAAKAVRDASASVASLALGGRATEIPGIGNTLQEKIVALTETGSIPATEKLRAKFPAGLVALTRLPGLGPKRARLLYSELGIDSLEALRKAAEGEQLRTVKGLGPKFEQSVLGAIDRAEAQPADRSGRILLPRATEIGEAIVAELLDGTGDEVEVMLAGSIRRCADSVKDIDIVATTHDPAALIERLEGLEEIESVGSSSPAGPHARRRGRGPEDGNTRGVWQSAPALHGLRAPQRRAARGGRAARPARLRVRDPRRRARLRAAAVRDRGRGVRETGPRLHRAGAARGPRRAAGGSDARRPAPARRAR